MTDLEKLLSDFEASLNTARFEHGGYLFEFSSLDNARKLIEIIRVQEEALNAVRELKAFGDEPAAHISMVMWAVEALAKANQIALGESGEKK